MLPYFAVRRRRPASIASPPSSSAALPGSGTAWSTKSLPPVVVPPVVVPPVVVPPVVVPPVTIPPVVVPPVTIGGTNALVLHVSEDAYQGDAQFVVSIDGQQVGGVQTASPRGGGLGGLPPAELPVEDIGAESIPLIRTDKHALRRQSPVLRVPRTN